MNLLQQTENAIQSFYQCQVESERHAAHQWLLELQTSANGWQTAWMLLDSEKPVEVQYYGACILYYKITHNMNDIDEEQLNEFGSKFRQLLVRYATGPKLVISKLCCVYSAFLVQIANESMTLLQCINDVESDFNGINVDSQFVMLELLTVLPNEFKILQLTSTQKMTARKFLNDFIPLILSMCMHILQVQNVEQRKLKHQNDLLNCLLGWVEFGLSVIDAKDLLSLLLSKIACEELSDKVFEVLIELITSPSSYTAKQTIFSFLHQMLQLQGLIEKAINEDNQEVLSNFCLLFTNLAETHCALLLKAEESEHQVAMLNLVSMILKFTSMKGYYPVDETCSELTLNFWYTLQDDLFAIDVDDITDYQKQFTEAYVLLIDVFFQKSQFPPDDMYAKFSMDDKERFRCYRVDIQDTMLYIGTLLKNRCLSYFSQKLRDLLSASNSQWQQFESILHLLRGATESIDTEESIYMPDILAMLARVPEHPKILDSLFFFLGGLSEWLNSHPNQITVVLPFLLRGILNPETTMSCSIALKDICHECSLLLHETVILEILQTCYKGLRVAQMPLKVVVRFFEIGGFVISVLPFQKMKSSLEHLVAPLFHWFKSTLQTTDVTMVSKKKLVHYLNCFQGLFRSLDPYEDVTVHPVATVYGQLIPLFRILKPWCGFEEIAFASSGCIMKAIEAAREKTEDHVRTTSEVLAEFFLTQPYGCVVDASAGLIAMFGTEVNCTERVRNLFTLLTSSCVKMVESGQGKNHPDCMQSFMDLLSRTIKTVPEFLYGDAELPILVHKCALVLLTYQETPTLKSTCNFLVNFINFSTSFENGKKVVETIGRDVLVQCLLCIAGVSPRQTVDYFAEILLSFNKSYITLLAIWLNEVFSRSDFPTTHVSPLQKEHFQKAVLKARSSKRRLKEMVKEFSLVCRGLNGTVYVQ